MHDITEGEIDVRLLVHWVGSEGAKAALTTSRRCSVKVLRTIAERLGCVLSKDMSRLQLITEILEVANKRIDKPLDALFQMNHNELVKYFTTIEVETKELLELLKELDVQPHRDGLRNLIEFAAQQISETGLYMRIAAPSSRNQATAPV